MIEIKNLTYQVKDKKILDDINLLIKSKEKIALIGPNGSGKTTLLRHLYKDINVSEGRILLDNQSIGKMKRNSYSKKVAVVSQENYNNYNGFSSKDVVMMGRYPYKGFFNDYDSDDKKIVEKCLMKVGMLHEKNREFSSLSGGEKQRVLIARAFSQESEIIILDEPINHLDIKYQIELMKLLKTIDKTVIMSLHNIEIALNWCDKAILLNKGKLMDFGKPLDVITEKNIKNVFEVDSKIIIEKERKSICYKTDMN